MMDKSLLLRKDTRIQLEGTFNAIISYLDGTCESASADLTAVLSSLYLDLTSVINRSPAEFIRIEKALRRSYVDFVRGGSPTLTVPEGLGLESIGFIVSNFTKVGDLRMKHASSLGSAALHCFDIGVIAFLDLWRVVVVPVEFDHGTITATYSGDTLIPSLATEVSLALRALGISKAGFMKQYGIYCDSLKPFLSMTGGPNGKSILSAREDGLAFMNDPASYTALVKYSNFSRLHWVIGDMLSLIFSRNLPKTDSLHLGKIIHLEEWGMKARCVATLDYWSQLVLSPLHDTVNSLLKGIAADCTFDQDYAAMKVQQWTKDGSKEVFSYDLTAATDRLPVDLQVLILTELFGSPIQASDWKSLLVARDYSIGEDASVKYGCGQPMGAKSSFPMLALTHHVLVQIAAKRAGLVNYKDYVIVGDDSTLLGSKVAAEYKSLITGLGVGISENKSFVHSVGLASAGEICKRLFVSGKELSALPVKLIAKTIKTGELAGSLHNELSKRSTFLDGGSIAPYVFTLLDKGSKEAYLKLNAVPSELSGLEQPMGPAAKHLDPENWFTSATIKREDLLEAYTFTTACEQLKRLDALLRDAATCEIVVFSKALEQLNLKGSTLPVITNLTHDEVLYLTSKLPAMTVKHPLVKAVEAEVDRISILLSSLQGSDSGFAYAAKQGIIDRLRSSLSDIWQDKGFAMARNTRSLLSKTVANISNAVRDQNHRVSFSIGLTSLERVWNLDWVIGGKVSVNPVKTRVPSSFKSAKVSMGEIAGKIKF